MIDDRADGTVLYDLCEAGYESTPEAGVLAAFENEACNAEKGFSEEAPCDAARHLGAPTEEVRT